MNKNILFLSYFFSPENTIGAVRLSKVAKYISKNNNVVVICAEKIFRKDETLERDSASINAIHRVMKAPIYERIDNRIKEAKESFINDPYELNSWMDGMEIEFK